MRKHTVMPLAVLLLCFLVACNPRPTSDNQATATQQQTTPAFRHPAEVFAALGVEKDCPPTLTQCTMIRWSNPLAHDPGLIAELTRIPLEQWTVEEEASEDGRRNLLMEASNEHLSISIHEWRQPLPKDFDFTGHMRGEVIMPTTAFTNVTVKRHP